tara:strand:- start:298 stop:423 length:126 start_codon:yes stop_codon:yes gene_type:complete
MDHARKKLYYLVMLVMGKTIPNRREINCPSNFGINSKLKEK